MHGPGASNSGGAGGEAKWKNTEILTSEGGGGPPGPPIVGNPEVVGGIYFIDISCLYTVQFKVPQFLRSSPKQTIPQVP